jgi:uncharacterized protein YtpQ (UPF0354 family)
VRSLFGLACAVVTFCGAVYAETLTPRAFTDEFVRAVAAALPTSTVTSKRELELTINDPSGVERTIVLHNAYREYSLDPERLPKIVGTFATTLSQPRTTETKVDRSRIVPVVKDRQWLDELHNSLRLKGVKQEHLAERLNNELVIVYAEDDPHRMRYLTIEDGAGIGRAELRALAVANLKRLLPKIEMSTDGDVSLISVGGDYEASLLLIDEIWSGGQIKVNGDIVVAIPARDVLLVTGSRSRAGLKRVRELAAKFAAEAPYRLTEALFVYRNGQFARFGRN